MKWRWLFAGLLNLTPVRATEYKWGLVQSWL